MSCTWMVMANHNGRHWLEISIPSLLETVPDDVVILVIDNGSTDGSVEYLRQWPRVRVIELARNLGFVQASNAGAFAALEAGADGVIFVNNDTRFEHGWFQMLQEVLDDRPDVGIVGVAQRDFQGAMSSKTSSDFKKARDRGFASIPRVLDVDWVEGSCFHVRRDVFERIGYFDPIYSPAYFEEMDFCRRALAQGIAVGLATEVWIDHHGAGAAPRRRSKDASKRRAAIERNYLVYHASDSNKSLTVPGHMARACRHGLKMLQSGKMTLLDLLRAWKATLQYRCRIRTKKHRELHARPCPLAGSGLPVDRNQAYYLQILELIHDGLAISPVTLPTDAANPYAASVVIPVRNRTSDLDKCLQCVLGQKLSDKVFEVLVCDDGSDPESSSRIASLCRRDPRVRYLRQEHKGPAAARNLGVRHARAEIVVFTDSDTLPQPGWLESILEPFSDKQIVAVEGPVRPPSAARSPLEEAPRNEGGVHLTANMAYRKKTLVDIGGLDESFLLPAFEDVDLALCASKLGRIVFASRAVVIHPWRKITLMSSLKRLRQLDWLIVTAKRHGCLGWVDRPTRHARTRVILAALVMLPLGRMRKSLSFLRTAPGDALIRLGISFIEPLVALTHVPRWLSYRRAPVRGRHLPRLAS